MNHEFSEASDEALAARVARKDKAAFALLYDRYARPVYVLAVHLLGAAEAEELTQEVFMRLWHKADHYDPVRGPFAAWFMTIARNLLKDRMKSLSQQQRLIAVEEIEDLLTDNARDVEEESDLRERGEALLNALRSLPEEQRHALMLAYFGGLSQSSIAEQLQWPLGTVKKRISLGLKKLRAYFNGQAAEFESESEAIEKSSK